MNAESWEKSDRLVVDYLFYVLSKIINIDREPESNGSLTSHLGIYALLHKT